MRELKSTCRVAVVQATPVMFDKSKCLEKALRLIDESADNGAELIVFPELFIPGYPFGMTFGFTVGSRKATGREDWKMYYDNSLLADGTEIRGSSAGRRSGACTSAWATPSGTPSPARCTTPT